MGGLTFTMLSNVSVERAAKAFEYFMQKFVSI